MNISHNWAEKVHMPETGMLVYCSGYALAFAVFLFSSVTAGVLIAVYATAVRFLVLRRNALEHHLCQKIEIADCANNARGIFLSTMSHEIRTPMNAVIGMTELLQETALDTEQEMFAKGIHESAIALMVIIDDILDFSKIDAGKLRLEAADCPLYPLMDDCLAVLGNVARKKNPAEKRTGAEAAGDSTGSAGQEVSILLVEDNFMNQKVAIHQLNALGYTAQLAINGLDALAMLEEQAFDLILLDCQMPLMDGLALTRHIRLQEKISGKHIKIVAMTANAMRGDRELCIDAGMDDYLTKPISRRLLLQALQLHLPSQSGAVQLKNASINEVRMRELFGEDKTVQLRMLAAFVETGRGLLQQLQVAATTRKKDEILLIAHRLTGSAGNLGLDELAAAGRAIETAIRAENYPHLDDLSVCAFDAFNTLEESVEKLRAVA